MLKAATAWEKVGIGITVLTLLYLGVTVVKPGLPSGHDIAAHAIWFKLFNEAIHQGQFPVRWIGLVDTKITGMPLFNFYPVGFYYLASSINIITNSLTESIKLTSLLLWWLSSFFVFLFLLRWGSIPALLGSIIYAYTPYLALDIFVRAAYPEFTALAFWPGIFWATDRLLTTSKTWFIIPLSIFLSLVIISHLPTLIIFTPILISYIIFLVFLNQVTLRSLLKTLFAGLIGVGLASFYLIPSILELSLIQKNYLTFGLYNYTHHFVLPEQLFKTEWGYGISVDGPGDGMSFQIGLFHLLIIVSALILAIYFTVTQQHNQKTAHIFFWLLAIIYSVFFMHDISGEFWNNILQLQFLQYPWRFLAIIPIAVGTLGGILLSVIKNTKLQVISMGVSVFLIFFFYHSFLKPSLMLPSQYFDIDSPGWTKSQGFKTNFPFEPGYLPAGVVKRPQFDNISLWQLVEGNAVLQPTTTKERFHEAELAVDNQTEATISLNLHYFPGWRIILDNIQEIPINTDNPYLFMRFRVPPGKHSIQAKFTDTTIRKVANILSLASVVLVLAITLALSYNIMRHQKPNLR